MSLESFDLAQSKKDHLPNSSGAKKNVSSPGSRCLTIKRLTVLLRLSEGSIGHLVSASLEDASFRVNDQLRQESASAEGFGFGLGFHNMACD